MTIVKKSESGAGSNSEAGAPPRRNASDEARRGAAGLRPARPRAMGFASPDNNLRFGEGEALAPLRRALCRRLAGAKPRPQNGCGLAHRFFHNHHGPRAHPRTMKMGELVARASLPARRAQRPAATIF